MPRRDDYETIFPPAVWAAASARAERAMREAEAEWPWIIVRHKLRRLAEKWIGYLYYGGLGLIFATFVAGIWGLL
jgi:hypothetical protein